MTNRHARVYYCRRIEAQPPPHSRTRADTTNTTKPRTKEIHPMAQAAGLVRPDNVKLIPLDHIAPSLTNKHTGPRFKRQSLAGLAASIKEDGIVQPLLVRAIKDEGRPGKRYEIVAGERRWRAAELAELTRVPCVVTELQDASALRVQLVENLQREALHPLDEAVAFLRLQRESELDVIEIAAQVGRDAREVARKLKLNKLIREAKDDFRADRITLGHALEICVLDPDVQERALAACYEQGHEWDQAAQGWKYFPDKTQPRSVAELQSWLRSNVHLNLKAAPFKTDDDRLREDGLTCVSCNNRTGADSLLFADVKGADTCLKPECFKGKVAAFVQITTASLDEKRGTPAPFVSPNWTTGAQAEGRDVLGRSEYELVEGGRDERCEFAEQAVYFEGQRTGRAVWICREATCKDHKGKVRGHASVAVGSVGGATAGGGKGADESKNRRKQELFDIKVDEIVRKRVFAEGLKAVTLPLDRSTFDWIALGYFRRIPSFDQKTIIEVFGFTEDEAQTLRMREDGALDALAKLDDLRLMQFMVLCSVAHFGANQYGNHRVSQQPVADFADESGVNVKLIDAEVRHELCAKKHKADHKAYLDAVAAGREAELPTVYERPQQEQQAAGQQEGEQQEKRAA